MNTALDSLKQMRESISNEPGLITNVCYDGNMPCAIGSLLPPKLRKSSNYDDYLDYLDYYDYIVEHHPALYKQDSYGGRELVFKIVMANNKFVGTPQERKAFMLNYIDSLIAELELMPKLDAPVEDLMLV